MKIEDFMKMYRVEIVSPGNWKEADDVDLQYLYVGEDEDEESMTLACFIKCKYENTEHLETLLNGCCAYYMDFCSPPKQLRVTRKEETPSKSCFYCNRKICPLWEDLKAIPLDNSCRNALYECLGKNCLNYLNEKTETEELNDELLNNLKINDTTNKSKIMAKNLLKVILNVEDILKEITK